MRGWKIVFAVLLAALPVGALAQEKPAPDEEQKTGKTAEAQKAPEHFYRLDFVIQELGADGKPVNSRSYALDLSTANKSAPPSIRTGARIPIATASNKEGEGTQFQYIDVGVNLDVREVHEIGSKLTLYLVADVTSIVEAKASDASLSTEVRRKPVIRQNRWGSQILIPVGKATAVFSSESLDSKGAMQVVVTATRID